MVIGRELPILQKYLLFFHLNIGLGKINVLVDLKVNVVDWWCISFFSEMTRLVIQFYLNTSGEMKCFTPMRQHSVREETISSKTMTGGRNEWIKNDFRVQSKRKDGGHNDVIFPVSYVHQIIIIILTSYAKHIGLQAYCTIFGLQVQSLHPSI